MRTKLKNDIIGIEPLHPEDLTRSATKAACYEAPGFKSAPYPYLTLPYLTLPCPRKPS